MTLAEFLLARIAEDEAAVRKYEREWQTTVTEPMPGRAYVVSDEYMDLGVDPARVRAECEAKRRIVELHRPEPGYFHHGASTGSVAAWDSVPPDADIADGQPACTTCGEFSEYGVPWPCPTLRLLALPYADHPDYRQEWALAQAVS